MPMIVDVSSGFISIQIPEVGFSILTVEGLVLIVEKEDFEVKIFNEAKEVLAEGDTVRIVVEDKMIFCLQGDDCKWFAEITLIPEY